MHTFDFFLFFFKLKSFQKEEKRKKLKFELEEYAPYFN